MEQSSNTQTKTHYNQNIIRVILTNINENIETNNSVVQRINLYLTNEEYEYTK